jgi:hypothetical protein
VLLLGVDFTFAFAPFPLQQATSDDADGVQCRACGPAQDHHGLRSDALVNRIASAKDLILEATDDDPHIPPALIPHNSGRLGYSSFPRDSHRGTLVSLSLLPSPSFTSPYHRAGLLLDTQDPTRSLYQSLLNHTTPTLVLVADPL